MLPSADTPNATKLLALHVPQQVGFPLLPGRSASKRYLRGTGRVLSFAMFQFPGNSPVLPRVASRL